MILPLLLMIRDGRLTSAPLRPPPVAIRHIIYCTTAKKVTGGISPNRRGWVGPFAGKLTTEEERDRHRVVTDAVHSVRIPTYSGGTGDGGATTEPGRICLQILHTGRYAYHPFAVSSSSTKSPISPFPAMGLSSSGVRSTIRDYANCAALARGAGYDGVEIMGSEGYLINQFLVESTNVRTDEYGGNFANRMRLAVDIVRETRAACGRDFIIIFGLSMLDLVGDGSSWDEIKLLAQALEDAGVTIINTGIGWHEARIREFFLSPVVIFGLIMSILFPSLPFPFVSFADERVLK